MSYFCEIVRDSPTAVIAKDELDQYNIDEWPYKWNQKEVSYRLNNHTQDIENQKWQDRAVTVAFRAWQLRIPLKFRRERNPDAHVDINVTFENLDHFN